MPFTRRDVITWEQTGDVEKFIQILQWLDNDPVFTDARVAAVEALGRLKPNGVIGYLMIAAKCNVTEVAVSASKVLADWAAADNHPFYRMVEDESLFDFYRDQALDLLLYTPSEETLYFIFDLVKRGVMVNTIQNAMVHLAPEDIFIRMSQNPDPATRFAALLACMKVADRPVILAACMEAIGIDDVQIQCLGMSMIIKAIQNQNQLTEGDRNLAPLTAATSSLVRNLANVDFLVRATAAETLEYLPDQDAYERLCSLLEDPYPVVRDHAIRSLTKIADEQVISRLKTVYQREENDDVKKTIIYMLSETNLDSALDWMMELIQVESNEELRDAAIWNIGDFHSPKPVDSLLRVIQENQGEIVSSALHSLKEMGFPETLGPVLQFFAENPEEMIIKLDSIMDLVRFFQYFHAREALVPFIRYAGSKPLSRAVRRRILVAVSHLVEPQSVADFLSASVEEADPALIRGLAVLRDFLNTSTI